MSALTCDYRSLFLSNNDAAYNCKAYVPICTADQSLFNFFDVYFCWLGGNTAQFMVLSTAIMVVLFKFICQVVEEYIAPAVVYLSKYLKLSEALAGVTLLAFVNGAGDVITAIVASDTREGISYNIGALYGAGLFFMTCVVALTVKYSPKPILVPNAMVYRDIGFYILATLMVPLIALEGYITWLSALFMLILYSILVIIVALQGPNSTVSEFTSVDESYDNEENESFLSEESEAGINRRLNIIRRTFSVEDQFRLQLMFLHLYNLVNKRHDIRMQNRTWMGKTFDAIDWPFSWLRRLTIPPVCKEHYDHRYTVYWPFLGLPFILWGSRVNPRTTWLLLLPVAIALAVLFARYQPKANNKPPRYFIVMVIVGIVNGILWTKLLCTLLVDLLTVIGLMFNLPTTYLGLTIVAIGTALQDLFTTLSIAKTGQAVLAITGGMVGQLFGLLVGFGVSMLKKTISSGEPLRFDLFNPEKFQENLLNLFVVLMALLTLVFIFLYCIFNDMKLDNRLANILLGIYGLFLMVCTYLALGQALK